MLHFSSVSTISRLLIAAVAVLAIAAPACALPHVAAGSSYNVTLVNFDPANFNLNGVTTTFDGAPQVFPLAAGGSVTVSETETDLGNYMSRIDITWLGNADLFPASLGGTIGLVNIGFNGNPLDLTGDVRVTSATFKFTLGNGTMFGSGQTLPFVNNPNPWDGFYIGGVSGGQFIGFNNSVGIDVRQVDVSITVRALIPEPATAALGLLSLGGLLLRRRRMASTSS